jgi:phospholipase/carboxylesterase
VLSGGLVGTGDATGDPFGGLNGDAPKHFDYAADLGELPIYLGWHARHPHIPFARVREGEAVHAGSQADCRMAIHPGDGHAITTHDMSTLRRLLSDPAQT